MNSTTIYPNPLNTKEKICSPKQGFAMFHKKLLTTKTGDETLNKETIHADATRKLFKYLRNHPLILDVTIKSNQLKFRLIKNDFAFNLLKAFFTSSRLDGVMVEVKKVEREYLITILSGDMEKIIARFKHLLEMVHQELKFRKLLKIQLKFDKLIATITNRFRPRLA